MFISSAFIILLVIAAIWNATNRLIGKARENAEKKEELYTQLLHACKMALLGELATGVAHEINNPLVIIIATTGVIKDRFNPEFNLDNNPEAILGPRQKIITHLACFLARLPHYIHQHISRYAPADVPCRRTKILRNLV